MCATPVDLDAALYRSVSRYSDFGTLTLNLYFYPSQTTSTTQDPLQMPSMTNCRELLDDRLQVQWDINANEVQIQLTGRITEDQYMAFGISGQNGRYKL
jgi:hypothetical protein